MKAQASSLWPWLVCMTLALALGWQAREQAAAERARLAKRNTPARMELARRLLPATEQRCGWWYADGEGGERSAREAYVAGLNGLLHPHRFVWADAHNIRDCCYVLAPAGCEYALMRYLRECDPDGGWQPMDGEGVLSGARRQ